MKTPSLFLDALHGKNSSRAPVWLMRQAGRYLPEYRKVREKYSFSTMYKQPEIAAEVTLMPIKRFQMDAAILFSDILVIPEALGLGLHFVESKGPVIERPLQTAEDVARLPRIDCKESFPFTAEAIGLANGLLDVPLIGFCGAPFTVASYMIEGGTSPDLKKTKQWMLRDPESFHRLLAHIAACSLDYLLLQVDAGVHAIQLFDSWASVLSHSQFEQFSLRYLEKMVNALKEKNIPVILFCRGSSVFVDDLAKLQPHGISVDWNADMKRIRKRLPPTLALQGNLDPDILYAPLDTIKREVEQLLGDMKDDKAYIFNLGHGLKPDMSPEAVHVVVDTVKHGSR